MTTAPDAPELQVEYCDRWTVVPPTEPFVIGREGHLSLDDNPYLHRSLLQISWDRLWWIANVGSTLTATVSGADGGVHSWLAPGGSLPLVLSLTEVRVTAGPTTYACALHLSAPALELAGPALVGAGRTTIGPALLTDNQRAVVVALAEPSLRANRAVPSAVPSSKEAAARLGWPITKFNRQLDAVSMKLAKGGVRGLHGSTDQLASSRRARLVEYALAVRLVTPDDLALLDREDR